MRIGSVKVWKYSGYAMLAMFVCAALYHVYGREGLQPVMGAMLLAGWSGLVAWTCYRQGLEAGYRQTMSLPPIENLFPGASDEAWDVLKESGDIEDPGVGHDEQEQELGEEYESATEGNTFRHNNF